MCRNIKRLYNLEPAATSVEIRESALQYVRKVSGYRTPSRVNEDAFREAVDEVSAATAKLLAALTTHAPALTREQIAQAARERAAQRFGGNVAAR